MFDNKKIINVSWAANQYIRMISEGSCDTDSDLLQNSDLLHSNKLLVKIYIQIVIIFHNITVFYKIFNQINAALVSKIAQFLLSKTSNILTNLKLKWQCKCKLAVATEFYFYDPFFHT